MFTLWILSSYSRLSNQLSFVFLLLEGVTLKYYLSGIFIWLWLSLVASLYGCAGAWALGLAWTKETSLRKSIWSYGYIVGVSLVLMGMVQLYRTYSMALEQFHRQVPTFWVVRDEL